MSTVNEELEKEEFIDNEQEDVVKDLLEVELPDNDAFLKIRETLTRIGLRSRSRKEDNKPTLYQSCHILHKKGRFYITHFKELFKLDGKSTNFDEEDLKRRNTIAQLLENWNLLTIKDRDKAEPSMAFDRAIESGKIVLLPYKEKENWNLEAKYNIGKYKRKN